MADWLLTRFYGAVMREGLEKRDVPDIDSQEFVHFAAAFGFNAVERAKLRQAIRTGQEAGTARRGGERSQVKEEEEEELLDYSDGHLKEEPMSNDESELPPHAARGPLSDLDLSHPRVRAGLKCATPECNFLVHRSPDFGGFCCRKCEWVFSVGTCSKRTKKHGPLCERRDAPSGAAVAPAVATETWSEEGGAEGGHGRHGAAGAGRRAEARSPPPPSPPRPPPSADEPWQPEPSGELDEGVVVWLRELRMVEFTEALTQLGIEKLEDLPFVSSEDLKAMGLSAAQQRKFRQGVEALRATLNLPRVRRQGMHRPPPL